MCRFFTLHHINNGLESTFGQALHAFIGKANTMGRHHHIVQLQQGVVCGCGLYLENIQTCPSNFLLHQCLIER